MRRMLRFLFMFCKTADIALAYASYIAHNSKRRNLK